VVKSASGSDLFLSIKVKPAANLSKLEEVLVITKLEDKAPAVAEQGSTRAVDILAQRLPSVPDKPAQQPAVAAPANPATAAPPKPQAAKPNDTLATKPPADKLTPTPAARPAGTVLVKPASEQKLVVPPPAPGAGTGSPAPVTAKPKPASPPPPPSPTANPSQPDGSQPPPEDKPQ